MKMLKKLALVSAVSMISAGAFAMEALDEETMSATTGQDGITINVIPGVLASGATAGAAQTSLETTYGLGVGGAKFAAGAIAAGTFGYKGLHIAQVNIHDDDGMAGFTSAGAIVIGTNGDLTDSTVVYADGTEPIVITIDSVGDGGAAAGNQAMLNVKITTPTLLGVKTGAIYVASSSDAVGTGDGMQDTVADKTKILDAMHISVGGVALNIQLGAAEAQGSMIKVTGTLSGGLSIADFALNDAGGTAGVSSGGKIAIKNLVINDAGAGTNLALDVSVDAVDGSVNAALNGLVITMTQLGTTNGIDIDMEDVALGAAGTADLGDVQLLGLNLNGSKLVIRGH